MFYLGFRMEFYFKYLIYKMSLVIERDDSNCNTKWCMLLKVKAECKKRYFHSNQLGFKLQYTLTDWAETLSIGKVSGSGRD